MTVSSNTPEIGDRVIHKASKKQGTLLAVNAEHKACYVQIKWDTNNRKDSKWYSTFEFQEDIK